MARYKPAQRNGLFVPVVFEEQIQPGTFEFALHHLVDEALDLSRLDARYRNDTTGASAYDPRTLLKIVLLAYSRGLITSRKIAHACEHNVLFMALSGDARPSYTQIAKFVRELGPDIHSLFTQVLLTCDRLGLIGRGMFAIDGVKLPANASKERSGTRAELAHRAQRLDKAAAKILALHQAQDQHGEPPDTLRQARIDQLQREAQVTRDFIATQGARLNRKGQELKTNITDPDSAKMATSKGVIQGYAAQAAVDSRHQIIVAADVIGSGSEQAMLLPMIEQTQAVRAPHTLITADAGYHSDANIGALHQRAIPALIADNGMRQRDERFAQQSRHKQQGEVLHDKRSIKAIKRFRPEDFTFHDAHHATCPAGKTLTGNGATYEQRGQRFKRYEADARDCAACAQRNQCLRNPRAKRGRQVARFEPRPADPEHPSQRMRQAIDSPRGRSLYSRRIATVEPVFANIRHHKRMSRFTLRGKAKVTTQWQLYCLVHNIEKLARLRPAG